MSSFQSYIGDLSQYLVSLIKEADVTDTIYLEGPPNAVQDVPDDFAILTFPLAVRNKGPFQLHQVRLEVVVKDMENARADILTLEERTNRYLALFPIHYGRFTLMKPYIRLKAGDGLGHHSWTVQSLCMVNTTDKYPLPEQNETTD